MERTMPNPQRSPLTEMNNTFSNQISNQSNSIINSQNSTEMKTLINQDGSQVMNQEITNSQNSTEMKDFNSQTGSPAMSQPTQEGMTNSSINNSNPEIMEREMEVVATETTTVLKKEVITEAELFSRNLRVAKFVGNRVFNKANILKKKKSLQTIGQQVPAVFIKATLALEQGLEAVDFENNSIKVTAENAENYIILIEGNHRYKAYRELQSDSKGKKCVGEFYFTEMLNLPKDVVQAIMDINTVTDPWKGGDYVNGAALMMKKVPQLLLELKELVNAGYSAEAASLWLTFASIPLKTFKDAAVNKKVDEKLNNGSKIPYGKRLLTASSKLNEKLLKSRTYVQWLANRVNEVAPSEFEATITKLESFINGMSESVVSSLNTAKKDGDRSKQDVIVSILREEYDAFLQSTEESMQAVAEADAAALAAGVATPEMITAEVVA